MTRSEGRASRQWVMQVVHVGSPDIKSAASLALLAKYYFPQDKTIYTGYRMMRIRDKWLKKLLKTPDERGGLTCAICKRQGLRPQKESPHLYITLDHIVEIAVGGSWNDESNFQVACNRCNNTKDALRQRKLEQTA
jgi:5-methylcytosine-specific restriction endonuclease McrA